MRYVHYYLNPDNPKVLRHDTWCSIYYYKVEDIQKILDEWTHPTIYFGSDKIRPNSFDELLWNATDLQYCYVVDYTERKLIKIT